MSEKVHTVILPAPEYDKEYWKDVEFDWLDSNFLVEGPNGQLIESGTVIRIRNKLEFLHHLTEEQLLKLKQVVVEAVDHELSKR